MSDSRSPLGALPPTRHLSVGIAKPFAAVHAFLSDPANFPAWASGLGGSFRHLGGADWEVETPEGPASVRFTPPNPYGVLDHAVSLPGGLTVLNPMRVMPNGAGVEIVFMPTRRPGVSEAAFERDADWVSRDLSALKRLLEGEAP